MTIKKLFGTRIDRTDVEITVTVGAIVESYGFRAGSYEHLRAARTEQGAIRAAARHVYGSDAPAWATAQEEDY